MPTHSSTRVARRETSSSPFREKSPAFEPPPKTPKPRGFHLEASLLPNSSSSKNFATCVVVDFAAARRRIRGVRVPRDSQAGAETFPRAVEWERQLAVGEVRSRAEIARREGLSRARVTQILGRRRV